MAKENAKIVDCPNGDEKQHTMMDSCFICAPYWIKIPICPTHSIKLPHSGFCKKCKKFYETKNRT